MATLKIAWQEVVLIEEVEGIKQNVGELRHIINAARTSGTRKTISTRSGLRAFTWPIVKVSDTCLPGKVVSVTVLYGYVRVVILPVCVCVCA